MNPSPFAQFWKIYPVRKDRKRAEDNFRRALKIAKAEEILAGAERYAAEVENDGRDRRFIKSPVSWLSGECWRDEILPPRRRPAAAVREVEPGDEWMLR
jgi:hypothetical protein